MKVIRNEQYQDVPVDYVIRVGSDEWGWEYEARGWFTYPRGSVLEGQMQEVCVADSRDLAAILAEFPDAPYDPNRARSEVKPVVPTNPPSDWSYYDAGERWGEDDY